AEHHGFAGGGDRVGERVRGHSRSSEQQQAGDGKLDRHGRTPRKGLNKRTGRACDAARDDVRPSRAKLRTAYAASAFSRFSATLSRKPVVDSQRWSAPTRSARSLVM